MANRFTRLPEIVLFLSLMMSAVALDSFAQNIEVNEGDVVVRDSTGTSVIRLDHSVPAALIGGSGSVGELRILNGADKILALLGGSQEVFSLRKSSSGFRTMIFNSELASIEAGGGGPAGKLVLKTSSNIPAVRIDGSGSGDSMEFFDGNGTAVSNRVYRLDIDTGAADHWGDTRFPTSDYSIRANDDFELYLDQAGSGDQTNGSFNMHNNSGMIVFSVTEDGDLSATGTKSAVVETKEHGRVRLYAVESTENWFEDFGSAQLDGGVAAVEFEPVFLETVNTTKAYHLTLTPTCPEPVLLFVSSKNEDSFTVQGVTLRGTPSECGFDYRITAKRLGYESLRLENLDEIARQELAVEMGLRP